MQVERLLRVWAADPRQPKLVLEVWAEGHQLRYLLGTPQRAVSAVANTLTSGVPGTVVLPVERPWPELRQVCRLRLSSQLHPLRSDDPVAVTRDLLSALHRVRPGELAVVQLVIGPRRVPGVAGSMVAATAPDGGERLSLAREKLREPRFACTLRIGASSPHPARARSLVAGAIGALRTVQAPGVRLLSSPAHPSVLREARSPWWWPVSLTVPELVGLLGWPLGEDDLPGVPGVHPRRLPPLPEMTAESERPVGVALAAGHSQRVGLSVAASLHHTWLLGPTGSGKSTVLLNQITADIAAGRGVVVIEPKGDLVDAVLARVPTGRTDDVVVLDPCDQAPVGLNPLAGSGPEQVRVDGLLSVFRALYGNALGPRTTDILHASLLTLARHGEASLVMVPLLLTNPGFRRRVVAQVAPGDPVALGPFWAWYEALSDAERGQAIAPVMNKLRTFLLSPHLRGVLGQRQPRLDLVDALTSGKILLVPLRKGLLGSGTSQLLGSLAVAQLWQTILGRASQAGASRTPVQVYIDEVQDYLHLPTDLSDALAQARGLGVGFTLAHQYLAQLPRDLRAGLLANVRSRVCFQLDHEDASVMAKGHPELAGEDFSRLDRYQVYASLFTHGRVMPYVSLATEAPGEPVSDPARLCQLSRQRFGQPLAAIEREIRELIDTPQAEPAATTGRRRRSS